MDTKLKNSIFFKTQKLKVGQNLIKIVTDFNNSNYELTQKLKV